MAQAQLFRMEKRSSVGGNLGAHIDGKTRPDEAVPREGMVAVENLDADGKVITLEAADQRRTAAAAYLVDCRKVRSRGPKPKPCAEFMVSGLTWDDPIEKQREYLAAAAQHVLKCGGPGMRIGHLALHLDETSPHGHIVVVCADEKRRLGWNRVRSGYGMSGLETGRALMAAMQDRFHADVGAGFGLERGQRGSAAKHKPIDRAAGVKIRLEQERERGVAEGEAKGQVVAQEEIQKRETNTKKVQAVLAKTREKLATAKAESLRFKAMRDSLLANIAYNGAGRNRAMSDFMSKFGMKLRFPDSERSSDNFTLTDLPPEKLTESVYPHPVPAKGRRSRSTGPAR